MCRSYAHEQVASTTREEPLLTAGYSALPWAPRSAPPLVHSSAEAKAQPSARVQDCWSAALPVPRVPLGVPPPPNYPPAPPLPLLAAGKHPRFAFRQVFGICFCGSKNGFGTTLAFRSPRPGISTRNEVSRAECAMGNIA